MHEHLQNLPWQKIFVSHTFHSVSVSGLLQIDLRDVNRDTFSEICNQNLSGFDFQSILFHSVFLCGRIMTLLILSFESLFSNIIFVFTIWTKMSWPMNGTSEWKYEIILHNFACFLFSSWWWKTDPETFEKFTPSSKFPPLWCYELGKLALHWPHNISDYCERALFWKRKTIKIVLALEVKWLQKL